MSQYDYLIIGTGMSALSVGALLSHAGFRILMLEAHDNPGGYAHTFHLGEFEFCAQVHYIWGCAPGQTIYQLLKHIGLEKEITFQALLPEGYDQVVLPDGNRVKIPYGFNIFAENIDAHYPGQKKKIDKFLSTMTAIGEEIKQLPHQISWWNYLSHAHKFPNLTRYKNKTLQNMFDELELDQRIQAILCANAGDLGAPPSMLSVFSYASLLCGYNSGAYYPTKHFSYFIGRLAEFIKDKPGCDILYNTEVTDINASKNKILGVTTREGKTFTADNYICNMDPQKAAKIIGHHQFPKSYLPALDYKYSPSSFISYLGVEGIDLRDYGFGNFNIWHLEKWDMNQVWQEEMNGNFNNPWLFISTPSLKTLNNENHHNGQTMEIGTLVNYDTFDQLHKKNPMEYRQNKEQLQEHIIDLIEKKYVPNLRKYIKVIASGTPLTNERFCLAPRGNCYGSLMTPQNMGLSRLKSKTPWKNLFWCNASSGYAGIYGTTLTGITLYTDLTNDKVVLDSEQLPTIEESVSYATKGCISQKRR